MVLRERALRLERRQHRHVRQLGELQELARGVGVVDALAHVEKRILRGEQRLHRRLHVVGIGTRLPALHGRVRMLVGVVLAEVARNDEEHRPRPARSKVGEGPAHVVRDELGAVDLAHPLGDRLECLCHVVVGVPRGAVYLRQGEPPLYRLASSLGPPPELQELSSGFPLILDAGSNPLLR